MENNVDKVLQEEHLKNNSERDRELKETRHTLFTSYRQSFWKMVGVGIVALFAVLVYLLAKVF